MGPKLRWVTVEQFESLGLRVCGVLVRTAEIRRSCGDPAEIGGGRSSFSIVRYRPGEGDCRSAPRPRRWIFLLFLPRVSPAFGGREIRPLGKAAEMQRRRGGAWGTPQPSPPTSLNTSKYCHVTPSKGRVILNLEGRTPYGVPGLLRAPFGIRRFHAGCSVLRKKMTDTFPELRTAPHAFLSRFLTLRTRIRAE